MTMHTIKNNTQLIKSPLLKPWISPGLMRCIENRHSIHRQLSLHPNNETLKVTCKRYRNYCNSLLKKLKLLLQLVKFIFERD